MKVTRFREAKLAGRRSLIFRFIVFNVLFNITQGCRLLSYTYSSSDLLNWWFSSFSCRVCVYPFIFGITPHHCVGSSIIIYLLSIVYITNVNLAFDTQQRHHNSIKHLALVLCFKKMTSVMLREHFGNYTSNFFLFIYFYIWFVTHLLYNKIP